MRFRVIAVVGAAAVVGGLALGDARDEGGGQVIGPPDVRERVGKYSAEQRDLIHDHLDRALSGLEGERTELAVAAALNTYLHQYLRLGALAANGARTLAAARGLCGNHAVAMVEMLQLAGIDSRTAVLLGIRSGAGNHSMVEVRFSDGDRGLFDPTHGAFFALGDDPVSLEELVRDPSLSVASLHTDVKDKRPSLEIPAIPMRSIAEGYRVAGDAVELFSGEVSIRWRRDFADNRGWGISYSGEEMVTEVPVTVGRTWGSTEVDPEAWNQLAAEHAGSGRPLAWAFVLGQSDGYDVGHDFRLLDTRPGRRYVLQLHVAEASGSALRLRIRPPNGKTATRTLLPLSPEADGWRPKRIDIPLTGREEATAVRVDATGRILLQGIRLIGVGEAARSSPAA